MKLKFYKNIVVNRKNILVFFFTVSMAISLSACQKTPKESIVKEKDFDKMIEQAQKTEEDEKKISKETGQIEMTPEGILSTSKDQVLYHVKLAEENKGVSVRGDAVMDIPLVDQYSIVKVKRQDITQEMVDQLLTLLAPGETWYDGEIALMKTKADTEKEIQFLKQMALYDYSLYTCQLCYEIPDIYFHQDGTKDSANGYRKLHVITYLRNYNGVQVNNLADIKHKEGESGSGYVKQFWPAEQLILYVNDDGVVGMDLNAPLVITEVTVDHSNVKSFEEIRKIFEQMVVIANVTEYGETNIMVEKVRLGYTMISAKDDFEHGYIVPVWDFRGEIRKQYELFPNDIRQDVSILTINAIDGTIIDRELGY